MLEHLRLQSIDFLERHGAEIDVAAGKSTLGERFIIAALLVGTLGKANQVKHGPIDVIFIARDSIRRPGGGVRVHDDVLSRGLPCYGWTTA